MSEPGSTKPEHSFWSGSKILAMAAVLLGMWLRAWELPRASLGLDGGLSLGLARLPFDQLIEFTTKDVHPPLYYAGMGFWLWLTEPSFVTGKFPGLFLGTIAIALLYWLVRQVASARAAALVALLLAVSASHAILSLAVRDYAPGLAFTIAALAMYVRMVRGNLSPQPSLHCDREREPNVILSAAKNPYSDSSPEQHGTRILRCAQNDIGGGSGAEEAPLLHLRGEGAGGEVAPAHHLLALTVFTFLALFTWYMHFVIVGAQAAHLLWERPRRRRQIVLGLALGVLGIVPWMAWTFPGLLAEAASPGGKGPLGEPELVDLSVLLRVLGYAVAGMGIPYIDDWVPAVWFTLLMAFGLGYGVRQTRRGGRPWVALVGSGLVASFAFVYVLSSVWCYPVTIDRYFLMALPLCYIAVAWAHDAIAKKAGWLAVAALVVLIPFSLSRYIYTVNLPPIPADLWAPEQSLGYIEKQIEPGDAILFSTIDQAGYYEARNRERVPWVAFIAGTPLLRYLQAQERVDALLPPLAARSERLWFLNYQNDRLDGIDTLGAWLADHTYVAYQGWHADSSVYLFYTRRPDAERPFSIPLGGQIELVSAASVATAHPGEGVPVALRWKAVAPAKEDYSVFVHLVDKDWKQWAQHDGMPRGGLRPTRTFAVGETVLDNHALRLSNDIPPGEYTVVVGLYKGGDRLLLPNGESLVKVAQVLVTPE